SHYEGVVSVNLTARHSGTWDAATKAADRVSPAGKPIRAIDSRNASVGQGLVTIAAAEAAATGGDMEAVTAAARDALEHTRTFALLKDIKFAVRGGRVPAIVGTIAKWLRLNVILHTHPDGRIAAGGGLIGRLNLRSRFARHVVKQLGTLAANEKLRILVGHGDLPEEAQRLQADLRKLLDPRCVEWLEITDMSPAVGVHGGPGTLIVAIQRKAATTSGGA
ncbi:MAG: DegV family protein, partial [Steroidobacteraceae bacterium]